MAENNNTKIIEESDLSKISGGLSAYDYEKAANDIASALKGVGVIIEKLGDLLLIINNAMETNTCPICNQKIVPNAEKCELMELLKHVKETHSDLQ